MTDTYTDGMRFNLANYGTFYPNFEPKPKSGEEIARTVARISGLSNFLDQNPELPLAMVVRQQVEGRSFDGFLDACSPDKPITSSQPINNPITPQVTG